MGSEQACLVRLTFTQTFLQIYLIWPPLGGLPKNLFSPFGQLGNRNTESLRGRLEVTQQDRGTAGAQDPETPATVQHLESPWPQRLSFAAEAAGITYFPQYLCTARLEQGPW